MEIMGKQLVTSNAVVKPPKKQRNAAAITPDRVASSKDGSDPPAKRLKTITACFKRTVELIRKDEKVFSEIDLVTAARDVLSLKSLSRSKCFFTHETTSPRGRFYCKYSGSTEQGVVDYGTSQMAGLDEIGVTGFGDLITMSDGHQQRVFRTAKASVDHMLCAIFLFHRSEEGDKKRATFMRRLFQQHGINNKDKLIVVKKQHAKDGDNLLFGLVKGTEGAFMILSRGDKEPLILPFFSRPLPKSLFG